MASTAELRFKRINATESRLKFAESATFDQRERGGTGGSAGPLFPMRQAKRPVLPIQNLPKDDRLKAMALDPAMDIKFSAGRWTAHRTRSESCVLRA